MTGFASGTLEIEFTAGVWTNVSAYYDLYSGVRIEQGRKTEFDDVQAATLTVSLWNDDGRFSPELPASPYYPNMVEGKRIRWKPSIFGVTYTRFQGWIQSIDIGFPSSSTIGSKVEIFAVDALGLLGQRILRSNATERALSNARGAGTWCDAFEFPGEQNGLGNAGTNYSTDASPGSAGWLLNGAWPTPTFGEDPDVSIGNVMVMNPDSAGDSNHPRMAFQTNPLVIMVMIRCPKEWVGSGGRRNLVSYSNAASSVYYHLALIDNAGSNQFAFYNNGGGLLGTNIIAPFGQWAHIVIQQNAGTAGHLDIFGRTFSSGTTGTFNIGVDVRDFHFFEPGSAIGSQAAVSFGSIIATGLSTTVNESDLWQSNTGAPDLAARISIFQNAVNQLPISFATIGSATVATMVAGKWSDRTALDVGQEMMRSGSGILWARGRDSQALWIAADFVRPNTPMATIDVDADSWGPPTVTRSVDSRPTRIVATYPGGTTVAIDSAAEAGGQIRSRTISTVCPDAGSARSIASNLLTQSAIGQRISRVVVDLTSSVNSLVPTLFSEASTVSGLFPTCRVRLANLPLTHFAAATRDAYVQGWREIYDADGARIEMDTTPAATRTIVTLETFTGSNGSGFSGSTFDFRQDVNGTGSALIQSNRGVITTAAAATAECHARFATTQPDVEITGLVSLNSAASRAVIVTHSTSIPNPGYEVILGTGGTGFINRSGVQVATWSESLSFATDYQFRIRAVGGYVLVRVWPTVGTEPGTWDAAYIDPSPLAGTRCSIGAMADGVNATARAVTYDSITITDGA